MKTATLEISLFYKKKALEMLKVYQLYIIFRIL